MAMRDEEQQLQRELALSAANVTQLSNKIDLLEEKNAILEKSLQELQATSATEPSTPEQTDEVANLKELVDMLDVQNAEFKQELDEYRKDPLDGRVSRLTNQLEIYKKLLTSDRFAPGNSVDSVAGTQMQKLISSGLHRHNPARAFVKETYKCYSEIVKERMELKVRVEAMKPSAEFAFDRMPGEDEIVWDDE
jgi:chromosome segregation ATPase